MPNQLSKPKGLSGITIGASGSGTPVPLIIVTVIVIAMGVVTAVDAINRPIGGLPDTYPTGFICRSCGLANTYSRGELIKIVGAPSGFPPIVIDCPKCKKHTHVEANICPKCGDIFKLGVRNCPKCGTDYSKAKRAAFEAGVYKK